MKKALLFILVLFSSAFLALADNIQFSASAPRVVEVGEQFEISFTITGQPSSFSPPEFKGLNLLGGPSTSSSSSVQFINGKVSQTSSYSYTYYFSSNKAGVYNFGPAKAVVDGKTYSSNSLTIEVAGGGNSSQQNSQASGQSQSGNNNQTVVAEAGNDDIFIRILVDKTSLYQGEHLVATIKLFSKLNISSLEKVEYPAFTGFFRQDIETPPLRQLDREAVNGQVYGTGIIQKMVLFPQKNGEIVIDPFSLQATIQIPIRGRSRSIFDDFWGPQVKEVSKKVISKPVKIIVKPLPGNVPESFHGAVGNFTFKVTLDKQKVKTNDAINLKIAINGNGNLKMIEPFDIKFPTDFEVYDPKINVSALPSAGGVNGSKTFEYLIIPRHSGNFKINPIVFTYFDTQTKQYKTLSSGELEISVEKGLNDNSSTIVAGVSKEDVKFLGKDIQFIKIQNPSYKKEGVFLFGSGSFWLAYLIPSILFIFFILLWRKRIKNNANIVLVRNKKANKVASKRLKDAHIYMKNNQKEGFYEYILKALWGYMSDKLSIPVSELGRERIISEAYARQIKEEILNNFLEIIDTCEFARYAPFSDSSQMDIIYHKAAEVISKIEQNIR